MIRRDMAAPYALTRGADFFDKSLFIVLVFGRDDEYLRVDCETVGFNLQGIDFSQEGVDIDDRTWTKNKLC